MRSPHGAEIAYVFDITDSSPMASAGGDDARKLAAQMSETWIQFARTGIPNATGNGLPAWRPYTVKDRAVMLFDKTSRCVNDPTREQRIALDKVLNPE